MNREQVVEEVAEAESALTDLSRYTDRELEAFNDRLRHLQHQATSLHLPTTKIDQLKLRVASAIGNPQRPQRTQQKPDFNNPGPRGHEKIFPTDRPAPSPPREPQPKKTPEQTKRAVEDLFGG